jgi:methylmalonyl-CoA mutase C-terminal domain/subunit
MDLLKAKGVDDVLVLVGGIVPDPDIPRLKALGVAEIFLPGTPMRAIVDFIVAHARSRAGA